MPESPATPRADGRPPIDPTCPEIIELGNAPASILREATEVCVEGRRFVGADVPPLLIALGDDVGREHSPKCQGGYPTFFLMARPDRIARLHFCAQVGAERGYAQFGTLHVADPIGVDTWLRARGFDVPVRGYAH